MAIPLEKIKILLNLKIFNFFILLNKYLSWPY